MDRLGETDIPPLVMAGRHGFQFPAGQQAARAAGITHAGLFINEDAGQNIISEKTGEVIQIVSDGLVG